MAPDSWADLWGASLGYHFVQDTLFPTLLGGTKVTIRDSGGVEHESPLHFASWGRVQMLIPTGLALGQATLVITNATGGKAERLIEVAAVAPGLFTANAQGFGPAAATWLLVSADGGRTQGFTIDSTLANTPLDLGAPGDAMYISFYGTGFRNARTKSCTMNGLSVDVYGAVAHPDYLGLDQAVVGPIPRSLATAGEVDVVLTFDGVAANTVSVAFQSPTQF